MNYHQPSLAELNERRLRLGMTPYRQLPPLKPAPIKLTPVVVPTFEPLPNLVETDGTQPGFPVPFFKPIVRRSPSALNVTAAVTSIRCNRAAERLLRADRTPLECGFPHDLGCETQIYLGLAIRAERPSWSDIKIAKWCHVNQPDAFFFATLLDIAHKKPWVSVDVLRGARKALRIGDDA